ncbi:hypothetical protein [Bradyrhizobium elkanii]|uniref:hypothetical protein n=1 Tax=Bradyrhizobium elkanii TaxID=29448 RepID=UPI00272C6539|nr:hypothetical protein [Bradyrhizobium elkanii]WLA79003.1 hypothetical protein QNJ99_26700 [Bradyrhizobium elkanii]
MSDNVANLGFAVDSKPLDDAKQKLGGLTDQAKKTEDQERGIEVAERAIEMAREEIIRDAEATPIQFNQAAAPHEAKAGVAWLRKELGRVVVVDLESRIGRQPTPEELETGVFFANYEDYASSNGIQIDRTAA